MSNLPIVVVEYRDKKNSSGTVEQGIIRLSISSRLRPNEREEHIQKLTKKLMRKINWAQRYTFREGEGTVKTDAELLRLAATINKAYYDLPLLDATFHKQKSTWGTCSLKTKQIYISQRLCGAPLELLWYVVTHEICHLAEPSHNQRFWELVSRGCPNYVDCRQKLNAYGLQVLA